MSQLLTAAGAADPFPHYEALLQEPGLPFVPDGRLVVRYAAIEQALRDRALGHGLPAAQPDDPPGVKVTRLAFIQRDPPDHTRLRKYVSRAFTPRTVAALHSSVDRIVARLLDELPPNADLIRDFAGPLPVEVIADMFAVPAADRPLFSAWSRDMVLPTAASPAAEEIRGAASGEFFAYLLDLVRERISHRGEDLVSKLAELVTGPEEFNEDDAVATCQLLLFAGHETTVNLLGNGTLALLRHPAQLALVRDAKVPVHQAIEELLRYDGPVHLTARTALAPTTVEDTELQEGDTVVLVLGAGNRDPRAFCEPSRLDVTRTEVRHLGFGAGIHFCLGAPLARLEAAVALPALLGRHPALALAGDPVWRDSLMLRGLDSLPVSS